MMSVEFYKGAVFGVFFYLPVAILLTAAAVIYYRENILNTVSRHFDEVTEPIEVARRIQTEKDRDEVLAKVKEDAAVGVRIKGNIIVRRIFDPKAKNVVVNASAYDLPGSEGTINGHGTRTPGSGAPTQTSMGKLVNMVQSYTTKEETKGLVFCALKREVLFMYLQEDEKEVVAAIDMPQYNVEIWKKNAPFVGRDGQMFGKRTQIALVRKRKGRQDGLPILVKGMESDADSLTTRELEDRPIFLSIRSSIKKEDWYHALLAVSANRPEHTGVWSPTAYASMCKTLEALECSAAEMAINYAVGRVFHGLRGTAFLENTIREKLTDKIVKNADQWQSKFLRDLQILEFNVGATAPILSNLMMKEHNANGLVIMNAHLSVRPGADVADSAKVKAVAKVSLGVGSVFDVTCIGHFKSIEGDIEIMFKEAPSNRVWWGFTKPPVMDYTITPVLSKKMAFDYAMITSALQKLISKAMADTVILPNMDDIAWFRTEGYGVRGIIDSTMGREYKPEQVPAEGEHAPVDMTTAAEDPSSATVDSTIRRRPTKAQTTDVHIPHETDEIPLGIPRTDTAPPGLSSQVKHGSHGRPSFLAGNWTPTILESRPASTDGIARPALAEAATIHSTPAVSRTASNNPDPAAQHPPRDVSTPQIPAIQTDGPTLRPASPAPFIHPTDMSQISPISTNSDTASTATTATTTSSILNSLRAGDRKALQGQVKAQGDKWKSGFNAWRNKDKPQPTATGHTEPNASEKPAAAPHSPSSSELVSPAPRRSFDQKPMSLQERLAAAAAAAASSGASNGASITRERSNTASSRGSASGAPKPALMTHPSKSGAPPVESTASAIVATNPPAIPAASTTSSASSVSTTGSTSESGSKSGEASNGTTPPASNGAVGKGIAVPPAPKPSANGRDTPLSTSAESSSQPEAPPAPMGAPPLPPRKSLEEPEKEVMGPPPLPARHASPSPPSNAVPTDVTPTVVPDLELKRSDSAPAGTTTSPPLGVHSPPKASPPALPPRHLDDPVEIDGVKEVDLSKTPEKEHTAEAAVEKTAAKKEEEEQKGDLASAIETDVSAPPAAPSNGGILVDVSPSKSTPTSSPTKKAISPNGVDSPLSSSPGSTAEEALRKLASRDSAVRAAAAQELSSPGAAGEGTATP